MGRLAVLSAMTKRRKFNDPNVKAVFDGYPRAVREPLLALRELIFEVADKADDVGEIEETLKWGQPSYLPKTPRTGTTVRIHTMKSPDDGYAMFFHCQTGLVDGFRSRYGDELTFEGNRAVVFPKGERVPKAALKHCVEDALTYHARKKRGPTKKA